MENAALGSGDRRMPLIAPGELIENFNKRSEQSNRKYRAFKNFWKQQTQTNGSGGYGPTGSSKNVQSQSMKPGGNNATSLFSSNTLKTVFKVGSLD